MALSEARINYIRSNAQKIARNKDVSKLVRAMRICNHLVNTSGLNALGLGTLIHGGGFFYLYKIWWGLLFAIIGYSLSYYLIKTSLCSFWAYGYEQNWFIVKWLPDYGFVQEWTLVKILLIADVLFHVVIASISAFITPRVREEAQFWLDSVPRETSSEAMALLARIRRQEA